MYNVLFFVKTLLIIALTHNILFCQYNYSVTYKIKGETYGEGKAYLICNTQNSMYTFLTGSSSREEKPVDTFNGIALPIVNRNSKLALNKKRAYLRDFKGHLSYTEEITDFCYTVSDDLKIDWQITDEYKKIGNYECKKAKAEVRGRIYEAWYAPELKVMGGPWKLYGLPGLILEAKSIDDKYHFIFEKIELMQMKDIVFSFHPKELDYASYSTEVHKHNKDIANQMYKEAKSRFTGFFINQMKYSTKDIEKNFEKVYSSSDDK